MAETQQEEYDSFDTAFHALINGGEQPEVKEEEEIAVDTTETAAQETAEPAVEEVAADAEAEAPQPDSETETPQAEPVAEAEEEVQLSPEAEANIKKNKEIEEQLKKQAEAAEAAKEEERKRLEAEQKSAPDVTQPSDEEKVLLEKFKEEWPDHFPAIQALLDIQRRQSDAKYEKALRSMAQKLYEDIEPVAQSVGEVTADSHFRMVRQAHEDFDAIKSKLLPWIEQQPPYLANTFKQVYNDGNAEEVIDLIQRFKDSQGSYSRSRTKPPAPNTESKVQSQRKLEALESVSSSRTTPQQRGVDANDYDTAFDEAVRAAASGQ